MTINTTAIELTQKIRSTIPLSAAMQFSIIELNPGSILVRAPLAPNVNIHGTGFAGSLYSIAVLSGWALCTHIMAVHGMSGDLVVAKAEIKYRSPVTGDISCCASVSEAEIRVFQTDFATLGKSRLVLNVEVGAPANAVLQGTYAAVARE